VDILFAHNVVFVVPGANPEAPIGAWRLFLKVPRGLWFRRSCGREGDPGNGEAHWWCEIEEGGREVVKEGGSSSRCLGDLGT
jgi:hypothetical protein